MKVTKLPASSSKTNRTLAGLVLVLIINVARKKMGAAWSPEIEALINEALLPTLLSMIAGLAVWFRQKSNLLIEADDAGEKDVQTPADSGRKATIKGKLVGDILADKGAAK